MPTTYIVGPCGTAGIEGEYVESGTSDGVPCFTKDAGHHLYRWNGSFWLIGSELGGSSTYWYWNNQSTDLPPLTGWSQEAGSDPMPELSILGAPQPGQIPQGGEGQTDTLDMMPGGTGMPGTSFTIYDSGFNILAQGEVGGPAVNGWTVPSLDWGTSKATIGAPSNAPVAAGYSISIDTEMENYTGSFSVIEGEPEPEPEPIVNRRPVIMDGGRFREMGTNDRIHPQFTPPEVIIVAVSDETTALTTGTAKITFRMPFAITLSAVRASLATASSSGNPTFDINKEGASILSTKLSIDATEKTSATATTPAVISDYSLPEDSEITLDIDTAGTEAKGAKITLIGVRT